MIIGIDISKKTFDIAFLKIITGIAKSLNNSVTIIRRCCVGLVLWVTGLSWKPQAAIF
jgi:hypothetical protein